MHVIDWFAGIAVGLGLGVIIFEYFIRGRWVP